MVVFMDQSKQLKPTWLMVAELGMASCGMEPEVLLVKAALLGLTIERFSENESQSYGEHGRWYCAEPINEVFYYAPTQELLAYRWLRVKHPEIFNP
jgi:hypothetical protein